MLVDSSPSATFPPSPYAPGDEGEISVSETAEFGGWVWVVLFGFVMLLSLLANSILTLLVLTDRRKRRSAVYVLLVALFALNLVDYGLLVFDFSLGLEHHFPHHQLWCTVYQVALKTNPILKSALLVTLLWHTCRTYLSNDDDINGSRSSSGGFVLPVTCAGVVCGAVLLAVPTALLAHLVRHDDDSPVYCELVSGSTVALPLYHLVYSAAMTYWIPLMISLPLLVRLLRSGMSDKHPVVSVALAAALSFFCFHLLHAGVVTVAHAIGVAGIHVSEYHNWMIKVLQSLLLLLAYFSHVSRPCLILLLDPDLKDRLTSLCSGTGRVQTTQEEAQVPLCLVVPEHQQVQVV